MPALRRSLVLLLLLGVLLTGAWWVYYPGLSGGFQFDDFANLPVLGATGPVDNWATFWRYLTSGHADPTGRPVALLSFLIDARDWPADPRPFLRTSVILHLVNGALLFLLLRQLGLALGKATRHGMPTTGSARPTRVGRALPAQTSPTAPAQATSATNTLIRRMNLAALVGAGLWLLHPLFVSTTLYIVQREAMLPVLFTLLGLLAWLHGRRWMLAGATVRGLAWLVLGLGVCTALGVLSKANGILLPALALVIEATLFAGPARSGDTSEARGKTPAFRHPGASRTAKAGCRSEHSRSEWPEGHAAGAACNPVGSAREVHKTPVGSASHGMFHWIPACAGMTGGWIRGKVSACAGIFRNRSPYAWAMGVLAGLPTAFVAWYLLRAGYSGLAHGVSSVRPWTEGQRLLTEPRVLMDYLQLLWLPHPFTPGLFNDQIRASASLLSPWTTLPCLLAVLGLIVGAWRVRRRWPALALAVLFYFAGQALESSTIALELYFEHRNYLPAMLMFWPLALWLCGVPQTLRRAGIAHRAGVSTAGSGRPTGDTGISAAEDCMPADRARPVEAKKDKPSGIWAKGVLAVLLLAGLAAMTHARTGVWGNTHEQALLWAKLNPDSPRAQANAAMTQMRAGHPARAAARLRALLARDPTQVQLAFNLFAAECRIGQVRETTLQAMRTALATTRNPGALLAHWFGRAIDQSAQPPCPQLTLSTLVDLIHAAQSNPKLMAIGGRRQDLAFLLGRIALVRGQPDRALAHFKYALDQNVRPTAAFEQVALLGSKGYPRRGLDLLAYYENEADRHSATPAFGMPRIHAWVLEREHYWRKEMVHLRDTLRADAEAR